MATDLNTASLRQLQRLPGVGETIAQRIVDARPFTALAQLQRVPGIGPKRYLALVSDRLVTLGTEDVKQETKEKAVASPTARSATKGTTKDKSHMVGVDLNTATLTQLLTLHGVGPKLAQRIVDARPFRRKDEVTAVRGIGRITYEKMQHQLLDIRAVPHSYASSSSEDDEGEEASERDGDKENEPQAASPTRRPTPLRSSLSPPISPLESTSTTVSPPRRRRLFSLHHVPSRNVLSDIRASVLPLATSKLLIASWNIRNLSKRRDAEPLHRIADILEQFDLVAMQEVRDTIVLRRLKHFMPGWDYIASPLVGAEAMGALQWRRRAEHFAYFYRRRVVAPVGAGRCGTDANGSPSRMVRPPFIATFRTIGTAAPSMEVTLVNTHVVCGDNASRQREMNELWRLTTRLASEDSSRHGNIMLVGDFNLSPQEMDGVGEGDRKFEPLILSPLTTTVGDKLLDNIWLNGSGDWENVDMESGVYRIDWAFYPRSRGVPRQFETQLTRIEAQTARVMCTVELSDHCPVWIALGEQEGIGAN